MSDMARPGAAAAAATAAAGAAPLLEARAVTRILAELVPTTLVRDVSLTIGEHELVAITGPSGSGKSSLLYLLGLLDVPTTGEVRIRGRATAAMDEEERAATRLSTIGFVFQFHFLLPEFSARENVMLPMRALRRLSLRQTEERADALLAALGLAEHAGKRPDQLPGGPRQRVAVARALATSPAHPRRRADRIARFEIQRTGVRHPARAVTRYGKTVVAVTTTSRWRRAGRRIQLADGAVVADERS